MQDWNYTENFDKIIEEVKDKLEFGLKKYKEKSYQSSEENFNNCDILQHLREELIDVVNYSVALITKIDMIKKNLGLSVSKWDGEGYTDSEDNKNIL